MMARARKPKRKQKKWVWHMTDSAAAKSIMRSWKLKPSFADDGDAFAGTGVYFTGLDPMKHTWSEIHQNNYDGGEYRGQEAFVRVDANKVPGLTRVYGAHREVHLAPTETPLDLRKVDGSLQWKKATRRYSPR